MTSAEELFPESCRVCLKCCEQARCLLIKSKRNKTIIDMLSPLMDTVLVLDPESPSNLCQSCEEQLFATYQFLEMCRSSNLRIVEYQARVSLLNQTDVKLNVNIGCTISKETYTKLEIIEDAAITSETFKPGSPIFDDISSLDPLDTVNEVANDIVDQDVCQELIVVDVVETEKIVECDSSSSQIEEPKGIDVLEVEETNDGEHASLASKDSKESKRSEKVKDKCDAEGGGFCSKCNRKTSDLKKHNYTFHESATARIFEECKKGDNPTCKVCGKQFKSNTTLRGHIKLVHTDDLPYKCRYCNRPTQSSTALIAHERLHTGEKAFICHFCGKGYPNKVNLKSHLFQHTGKNHFCKICGKAFSRNSFLQLHMKRHTGDFRYLCTQCGKKFIVTAAYKEHLRIHTNERPFKCEICDKAFKKRSTWRRHLGIHSGYKPLQCKHCPYACAVPYRLRQHMKTHDKEINPESYDSMSADSLRQ